MSCSTLNYHPYECSSRSGCYFDWQRNVCRPTAAATWASVILTIVCILAIVICIVACCVACRKRRELQEGEPKAHPQELVGLPHQGAPAPGGGVHTVHHVHVGGPPPPQGTAPGAHGPTPPPPPPYAGVPYNPNYAYYGPPPPYYYYGEPYPGAAAGAIPPPGYAPPVLGPAGAPPAPMATTAAPPAGPEPQRYHHPQPPHPPQQQQQRFHTHSPQLAKPVPRSVAGSDATSPRSTEPSRTPRPPTGERAVGDSPVVPVASPRSSEPVKEGGEAKL